MAKKTPKSRRKPQASPVAKGEGRIRPRARLLRTIGADLISSETVAILELVRNCFDADATRVEVVFDSPENPEGGWIEIRDNGHGMTRDVLLGPWLEPATDYKTAGTTGDLSGERSPGGRRRLGSKGVGRFAAQRLGHHLIVKSQARGAKTRVEADFDWMAIEEGTYLDEIRIPWQEHNSRPRAKHGTTLRINQLTTQWSPDLFDKVKLGLSRLVNPSMRDEFEVLVSINGASEEIHPALDSSEAMYRLRGTVEPSGKCEIHYVDFSGDEEQWDRTVIWPAEGDCGAMEFEISAWDLDSKALRHFFKITGDDHGLRNFRRALRDHSGISLYRDGFRVLPYGEADNDWLRLDRRRVNNPTLRLSNNQILGRIQITADGNPDLRDQTNREGLVGNNAYAHLQEIVLELLQQLELRRFTARRSMDWGESSKWSSLPIIRDAENEDRLNSVINSSLVGSDQVSELREMFREVSEFARDSVRHYAGLASAGQLAGLVFKQLEHPLRQLRSDLALVLDDVRSLDMEDQDLEDMEGSLRQALQHTKTMAERMTRMNPLAIGGAGRRVSPIPLSGALEPVIQAFEGEAAILGVSLYYDPESEVEIRTNQEIAQHTLANLLDNAIWWSTKGKTRSPVVKVHLTPKGFTVSDNGPGIAKEHAELIYEANFSTREDANGLGLTLARDLLATIGGKIELTKRKPATFSVQLTKD